MKRILHLFAIAALLAACSTPSPAAEVVTKNGGDDTLTEGFVVPLGKTVTINGTIVNNGTASGFGEGTVTSVGLSLPALFGVSGSPVTTSGNLTATLATQGANKLFAGPTTGSDATPAFRSLVAADIPDLSTTYQPLLTLGVSVQPALAVDVGGFGSIVLRDGDYGTPSSMDGTNVFNIDAGFIAFGKLNMDRLDIASQAEAEAGTSTVKVMTPQRTAQAIAALATAPLPRGYIGGLRMVYNSGTLLDVKAGVCRDDTNTHDIVLSDITKDISASFAAGTNNGGLQTGLTLATNTNYSVWAILNTSTGDVDVMFSTSETSPTLPGSFDAKRRIGWVRNGNSGGITEFFQRGDKILLTTNASTSFDYFTTLSTSTDTLITCRCPPNVVAAFRASGTASATWLVRFDLTASLASFAVTTLHATIGGSGSANPDAGRFELMVDSSSQIRARAATTVPMVSLFTTGWTDTRGRDD